MDFKISNDTEIRGVAFNTQQPTIATIYDGENQIDIPIAVLQYFLQTYQLVGQVKAITEYDEDKSGRLTAENK